MDAVVVPPLASSLRKMQEGGAPRGSKEERDQQLKKLQNVCINYSFRGPHHTDIHLALAESKENEGFDVKS